MSLRVLHLTLALLVAQVPSAVAQDREVVAKTLAVGTSTSPSGSSVTLDGLATAGATEVLLRDATTKEIAARLLGKSDLPSAVGYTDEAETWSQPQTFSGGIVGPLSVTTSLSSPLGYFSTRVETPSLTTGAGALGISAANGLVSWGAGVTAVNPTTALRTSLGTPQIPYGALSVGELKASAFVANYTQAYTEASLRVGRGSKTTRALGASDTVLFVDRASYRYLDYLTLRTLDSTGMPQFEILRVVSAQHYDCTGATSPLPSNCGGVDNDDVAYVVERDKDGTGANSWEIGTAAVSRDRWIEMYSEGPGAASYGSAVLADRPLGYWTFDGGSSPTPNRAPGFTGYAGARTGLTVASGASTSGGGGFAAAEDPTTGYGAWYRGTAGALTSAVTVPETESVSMRYAWTIEMVYYGTAGAAYAIQPVARWDTTTSNANFVVYHFGDAAGSQDGKMNVLANHNGSWRSLLNDFAVPDNAWTHIVMTWDADNGGKAYVNGTLVSSYPSQDVGQPVNGLTESLRINAGAGGYLSELALYDRVIDTQAVVAHYRALTVARPSIAYGPTVAGHVQTSTSNWYDTEPRWAAGNLAGLYGYGDETFGFAAGKPSGTWVAADEAYGFRVMFGSSTLLQADTSGSLSLVGSISSAGNWSLTPTTGLTFEQSSSSSGDTARSIRWASGGSIFSWVDGGVSTLTLSDTNMRAQAVNQLWLQGYMASFPVGVRLANNVVELTGGVSDTPVFRPDGDGEWTLGDSTHRFKNIHLNLGTAITTGSNVVVLDPTDTSRFKHMAGWTGTCSAASFTVQGGIITSC